MNEDPLILLNPFSKHASKAGKLNIKLIIKEFYIASI